MSDIKVGDRVKKIGGRTTWKVMDLYSTPDGMDATLRRRRPDSRARDGLLFFVERVPVVDLQIVEEA